MKFIVNVRTSSGDSAPYRKGNMERIADLQEAGTMEGFVLRADLPDGPDIQIVLQAPDLSAAREVTESLPLVAHGFWTYEISAK